MFKKLGGATASKLLPTALIQHGFILRRWGLDRRDENRAVNVAARSPQLPSPCTSLRRKHLAYYLLVESRFRTGDLHPISSRPCWAYPKPISTNRFRKFSTLLARQSNASAILASVHPLSALRSMLARLTFWLVPFSFLTISRQIRRSSSDKSTINFFKLIATSMASECVIDYPTLSENHNQ